jgi:FlaA1/EpsC-like NDP-sugar epimerase
MNLFAAGFFRFLGITMNNPLKSITKWPVPVRRIVICVFQAALICFSLWLSFLLRFDLTFNGLYHYRLPIALSVWVIAKTIVFRLLKLDRGWWIGFSFIDAPMVLGGNLVASGACYVVALAIHLNLPRSIFFLDSILCFMLSIGAREGLRFLVDRRWLVTDAENGLRRKVLIYGAGQAGITLMNEIRRNPTLRYRVCGFIDEDRSKKGLRIAGVKVLGDGKSLPNHVHRFGIENVLIAIPSATGTEMSQILQRCHDCGVDCRTVPGLAEMITTCNLAGQIREVAVEDLLGRLPVALSTDQIRLLIEDQIVLVTGAGGSIGSELCRQIARFHPSRLIGFEIAESALFEIERHINQCFPGVPFHAEIGNIQNRTRLAEAFERHRPSVVFHAAAYKHVPLMEAHAFEAVENNILGSYNVAQTAIDVGVGTFVLISTDKAVNPSNMMGVTKRITELLLLDLQSETNFVAVRFGNVLGSNGSVIPIFKKQIASGGPVTVTHPEMRRFFMTIPEACQLVLQAATVANGGQICVLDMGEPVRILDLATKLILLSGLAPGRDIEIQFTGLRPGEKLSEELVSDSESCTSRVHEKIMVYKGTNALQIDSAEWIAELEEICRVRDFGRLLISLKEIVVDYNPSFQILKQAFQTDIASRSGVSRLPASISGLNEVTVRRAQVQ